MISPDEVDASSFKHFIAVGCIYSGVEFVSEASAFRLKTIVTYPSDIDRNLFKMKLVTCIVGAMAFLASAAPLSGDGTY